MTKNNMAIAEEYYKAMGEKNMTALEKYLHPNVQFIGPLGEKKGKEIVLDSIQKFAAFFKTLTIRSKFGSEDQAMIVYDVVFPDPIGKIGSAALMTLKEGIVIKIELFFDGTPFAQMNK